MALLQIEIRGSEAAFQHVYTAVIPPFPGSGAIACRSSPGSRAVSIHAPRFREAEPLLIECGRAVFDVSIHAPRFREAERCNPDAEMRTHAFQSTLPVSGKRSMSTTMTFILLISFQSTLPVSGKRSLTNSRRVLPISRVSIHAPRFREAERQKKNASA